MNARFDKFLKYRPAWWTPRRYRNTLAAWNNLRTCGRAGNLDFLARFYGTDKCGTHSYTMHYETHFRPFRPRPVHLLEIGVGGYKSGQQGGGSLRMWKRYFPRGRIYSVDIFDKSALEESRIRIFRGSQVDHKLWEQVFSEQPEFDLIIDDGSHRNEHIPETFRLLFPRLKNGGIYVVEDTQTSYWPLYGGDSLNLDNPATQMNFFKRLVDGLNHQELVQDRSTGVTEFDRQIVSIHFYHNMVFIYKGANDEPSNKFDEPTNRPPSGAPA
jgi:hypothetical protein